jgi:hypothetical protein
MTWCLQVGMAFSFDMGWDEPALPTHWGCASQIKPLTNLLWSPAAAEEEQKAPAQKEVHGQV